VRSRPTRMDVCHMVNATGMAKHHVEHILKLANAIQNDTCREERLKKHECIACFYGSHIGGASITEQPCGLCGKTEYYCSTSTDDICMECAKEHHLCKHCGGDLDMKVRRRNWPKATINRTANEGAEQ
jgi:hypothetical protein